MAAAISNDGHIDFFAEFLTKLGILRIFLDLEFDQQPRIGSKHVNTEQGPQLALFVFQLNRSHPSTITIPLLSFHVDLTKASQSSSQKSIILSFPISKADSSEQSPFNSYNWTFSSPNNSLISVEEAKQLMCRYCGQKRITKKSNLTTVTMLPTEYWGDMRDLWTCMCTAEAFERKLPKSTVVRAIPGTLQSGPTYFQLGAADLDVNTVMTVPYEPIMVAFHANWLRLCCACCTNPCGLLEVKNPQGNINQLLDGTLNINLIELDPNRASEGSYPYSSPNSHPNDDRSSEKQFSLIDEYFYSNLKLFKHCLKTEGKSNLENHRLETSIASDLITTIGITNTYKFMIRDFMTREYKLKISVLNWDTMVFSSRDPAVEQLEPSSLTPYSQPMPVVKIILQQLLLDDRSVEESGNLTFQDHFEVLEYDAFSIAYLEHLLMLRHNSMPEEIRRLGKKSKSQQLSFLFYVPFES